MLMPGSYLSKNDAIGFQTDVRILNLLKLKFRTMMAEWSAAIQNTSLVGTNISSYFIRDHFDNLS